MSVRFDCLGIESARHLLLWPEQDLADGATIRTGIDLVLDERLLRGEFMDFGKAVPVGFGYLRLRARRTEA